MNRTILTGLTLCFALTTTPAFADLGPISEKQVQSGKEKLDPSMGYILLQSPERTYGLFLRLPDAESKAAYQRELEEELEKEKKKYPARLKRWAEAAKLAKGYKDTPPPRPVEPTLATVSLDPLVLRGQVAIGPMNMFNKTDSRYAYLSAVKPGTYVYYGPMIAMPGAVPMGTCYCMGSVQFEVKPGILTDLGNFIVAAPTPTAPFDVTTKMLMEADAERKAKGKEPVMRKYDLAFGLPETLKDWPSERAAFRAHGKMNNYFGLPISRIAPIEGVIGYRRDTIIDLVSGEAVASPTIVPQVKIKR